MPPARTPPTQIALPLLPGDHGEAQRIVVGNANRAAAEALQAPATWPFHTAVLTGPARSGKTLLGRWAEGQGIEVIDGADRIDEAEVFHRWNKVQEGGAQAGQSLLLIADAVPWEVRLPDLASRLGGSLQLAIGDPDDEMAAQLIMAHASARGLSLPAGAADYLVPRTRRSFAALEALVAAIDRISLERAAPPTLSVWRAALEALHGPPQAKLL
ncbi:HdaA/DnaA family protein [Erythrobacter sp.]|jgi:chromosomal replication initiation ATPase DnaA|uniref:HdaA/DnaA family protein n=1 Tax=Erythrobacter sp. TaxID=1042 RepID=UPI002EB9842C|nr:DnaA/Hda family protein [Erythrobacter sp.]